MEAQMGFITEQTLNIVFIMFFVFIFIIIVRSMKNQKVAFKKNEQAIDNQDIMLERQAKALKQLEETNRLLAEILTALKK